MLSESDIREIVLPNITKIVLTLKENEFTSICFAEFLEQLSMKIGWSQFAVHGLGLLGILLAS